ncbi:MAG: SDR family NAD(P)-dependent oxidoreductase [Pseudomonadota bacterium]
MRRNRRWWRSVVLTGASGGIGRALARELASDTVTMVLLGRHEQRLEEAADGARRAGANVTTALVDVTDRAAMETLLAEADAQSPIDLVIANAGRSLGTPPSTVSAKSPESGLAPLERAGALAELTAVNLVGAANTVEPLLGPLAARRRGRIVFMGSLAGQRALPDMPAYSASKAGLRAWATALRGALAPVGIGVTHISAGFVTSPMSHRHLGRRPFEISAAEAAPRIRRGIERGVPLIAFPWPLVALAWCGARLPPTLSDLAIQPFAARIVPEDEGAGAAPPQHEEPSRP